MTGRPPLPIGAHGAITPKEIRPGVWRARTYHRDADGRTRLVERTGRSSTAATNALQHALTQRSPGGAAGLTGASRVRVAAAPVMRRWQEQVDAGSMAPRSLEAYESALRLHVLPALGELRLREATTARVEEWLTVLRRERGAETCRRARTVLSAILGYAARMGAIATNPVRDLSPIVGKRKRKPRAMTPAERTAWLTWMDTNAAPNLDRPRKDGKPHTQPGPEVAKDRALGDITRFMLATGCRIGETMAVGWDDIDFVNGTVAIRHHLVRVKGRGVVRMEGAKSEAGDRVLELPSWTLDMLRARRTLAPAVFPDMLAGWRDPNLVMRWFRWSRKAAGFDWVTSHVFRQTVITVLDEAGLSTREVADQAGHAAVSMTQSYMARRVASPKAREALEGMLG